MSKQQNDALAYIGGEWLETGKWRDNINPADTRDIVGRAVDCGTQEAKSAIAAAKSALPKWKATPAPVRGEIILRAMLLMENRLEELAQALSREQGKVLAESRGEVKKSIKILEFISGEGRRFGGDVIPSEMPNTFCYTIRQPLGVVGLITPWNFPVAIPVWKIAPALVAGNTVVFKPAKLTPLTGRIVTEIFLEAGIPPGVLNFLPGPGSTAGNELATNPDVAAISFTGSNEIGMHLYDQTAKQNKKCQCEMGGKNPLVLLADGNVALAAAATIDGAFGSTGQRCTATSRAIVERPVYDEFVQLVAAGAKKLHVGNPLHDGIQMGPSVDSSQYETVHKYIQIGKGEAKLAAGGNKLTTGEMKHGFFTEPTVFVDVKPDARIAQEEIFGPVLSVIPVDNFDEALEVANNVKFGLSSSVYTNDLRLAQQFVEKIETGITHVNSPTLGGEAQLPFGGIKATGVGEREMGPTAVQFYSELKTVYVDYTGTKRQTNIY
ncbi:MAG: aldehyde dehydrogenase family protein [Pseudomonadota bacterium]